MWNEEKKAKTFGEPSRVVYLVVAAPGSGMGWLRSSQPSSWLVFCWFRALGREEGPVMVRPFGCPAAPVKALSLPATASEVLRR